MFDLQKSLRDYQKNYPEELAVVADFERFLASTPLAFHRESLQGHFTSSAWILSPEHASTLLTHHRKLNMWIQLGGHCDGDSDVLASAQREAVEESGITEIRPIDSQIFDIDKHFIPARPDAPEHFHYDIRFLFQAANLNFVVSPESKDLGWKKYDDPFFKSKESESIKRMHKKWLQFLGKH